MSLTNYEKLKQVIQAANSEKFNDGRYHLIVLTDVLLAIRENRETTIETDMTMLRWWNLRADDLTKQGPDTIEFLINLLVHE